MVHSGLWAGSALQLQTGAPKNNSPRSFCLLSHYFLSLSSGAEMATLEWNKDGYMFFFFSVTFIVYYKLSLFIFLLRMLYVEEI